MKKKLVVGVLSAVLLAGGATAAFGATDSAKLDEIKSLTQQMFGIQKQIVDKEVEAGLRTTEQADAIKKFIDKRQAANEQALANGKVLGPGSGKGSEIRGNIMKFKNGNPMTDEQIEAWYKSAQARLTARVEAMKSSGKLTEEQIKTWSDAAQAQLEVQKEAMLKSGTFIPGEMGFMGKQGGHGERIWGKKQAPEATTSDTSSST